MTPPEIRADPDYCFGAPRLAGYGVRVEAIVDRFVAGDSVAALALDYDIPPSHVEACLRWRLKGGVYAPKGKKP